MEKLVEVFSNRFNSDYATYCAEFCKEIAIEFTKYIMSTPIREQHSPTKYVDYIPKEFDFVKGLLLVEGDKVFNDFLEDYAKV